MKIQPFLETYAPQWEEIVGTTPNSTFQHTRRFLSYHGQRFKDASLLIEREGKIIGVFPAAFDQECGDKVISHPGATYGGILHTGREAKEAVEILRMIIQWYHQKGISTLIYKSVPYHLHSVLSQADQYALLQLNAKIYRRDLWNVIPLNHPRSLSKGRKWGIKKAKENGIEIKIDNGLSAYQSFYQILSQCLKDHHGVNPIHSAEEMISLKNLFPSDIDLWIAKNSKGMILAGSWIFSFGSNSCHTQYIASTEEGRHAYATDFLIENIIQETEKNNIKYFSFGSSTEQEGKILNSGLYNFKAGFGYGSVIQDFYLIDCNVEV